MYSSVPVLVEAAAAGGEYEGALAIRSLVSLPATTSTSFCSRIWNA